jgi:hypothetical protein
MKALRLLKPAVAVDAVGALETELAKVRAEADQARADAQPLGREWLHASSQAAAEEIGRARVEAERVAARSAARMPELEQRLAEAKAEKQREGLERHRAILRAFIPRLIAAVEAAAAVQIEAIRRSIG